MGGANGSRECAPDDKLRDTHQLHLIEMGFRRLNPSYELELMFLFIPIGPQQIFETHCIWFKALAEQCRR